MPPFGDPALRDRRYSIKLTQYRILRFAPNAEDYVQ
jgi:hypothetical protein